MQLITACRAANSKVSAHQRVEEMERRYRPTSRNVYLKAANVFLLFSWNDERITTAHLLVTMEKYNSGVSMQREHDSHRFLIFFIFPNIIPKIACPGLLI
jgi:hypothetical protein